ncbi:hypothetical protein BH23GEM6_BH23GEM6_09900 [soil metagenome]
MISKAALGVVIVTALALFGCNGDRDQSGVQQDGLGTASPAELAPGAPDPGLAPGGPGATGTPGSMAPDGTMPQDTLGRGIDGGGPAPGGTGRP